MREVTSVIVQTHQILRLPPKMNLTIDPWHKWNVIYNARSNMRHSPNSPNTAPATKNDRPKSQRNLLKTDETSFPMRGRSDHDPSMIRPWSEHETVSPQPASQPRWPFPPTTSILYWKIQHFALQLSFQISPNTAPATKSDTWTSPYKYISLQGVLGPIGCFSHLRYITVCCNKLKIWLLSSVVCLPPI